MSHADFIPLLQGIYSALLNSVKGLQTQGNIIVEVLASGPYVLSPLLYATNDRTGSSDPPNIPPLEEEFGDILSSAAELCNTRAATVVSMRSEQHAQLDLPEFLVLFNESWNFVLRCEIICMRMIVGLRGVIVGQVCLVLRPSPFAHEFH
jgi:vacuolar protein sorting-associated protein 54